MAIIEKQFLKEGMAVVGALVVLKDKKGSLQPRKTTTDRWGKYRFEDIQPGVYEIQFFASDTNEEDWIEELIVPEEDSQSLKSIVFVATPTLSVSEGDAVVDTNGAEWTTANISLANLETSQGSVADIILEAKRSSESTYKPFSRFNPENLENGIVGNWSQRFTIQYKPESWDFRAIFLNGAGELAKQGGVVVEALDLGKTFDGVPDFDEYVEAVNVEATNTDDPEGNCSLKSNLINIKFDDIALLANTLPATSDYFPIKTRDAFGNPATITRQQAAKKYSAVVFMFISTDGEPPTNEWPGISSKFNIVRFNETRFNFKGIDKNDPHGQWVYVGEFDKGSASIITPKSTTEQRIKVGLWVGYRMKKTSSRVPQGKESY